jgi:protein-tyrosine kinase
LTRLTEALERARSLGHTPTDVSSPRSSPAALDVPLLWQLDEHHASGVETEQTDTLDQTDPDGLTPGSHVFEGSPRKAEGLQTKPLGLVSGLQPAFMSPATAGKLVVGDDADPAFVEQYRRLAAALHHSQLQSGTRSVMIVSAVESEGKTLTATNVALTLSHSYQKRVLLIDADLRRPSVHEVFRLDNRLGLGEVLKGSVSDGHPPVHKVSPTLWIMTAGHPNQDPMGALVSDTMRQFLLDAGEQFDWLVVDTPPVAILPDANLLIEMVDVALLVVRANTTPYQMVMRAVDAIGASRVLGVVLNRADHSEFMGGYASYSYSVDEPKREPERSLFGLFRKR